MLYFSSRLLFKKCGFLCGPHGPSLWISRAIDWQIYRLWSFLVDGLGSYLVQVGRCKLFSLLEAVNNVRFCCSVCVGWFGGVF